ncbi:hypothetical protein HZF05_06875 [Sphingomonas sp. CGMCC 1.13654]|uniref:DUF6285 domain-containing protein n=1 Tax=Sphingomonas chungangi TaxID=2683589 RepID=A0A838L5D9_9SPHN|nr:DUF6285 domain-containing protein [Sphingomonas chungangi]MBA2933822.1 hypothetical protein [Sphingomonas chungangi]MVW55152.1 hypothetical protein [Sphingomonas chungangi]
MTMQDRPGSAAILEAVAAFLRNEVLPAVSGTLAFRTRVAANAVDLVRREIDEAGASDARLRAAFSALLGSEGEDGAQLATLSNAIAEGRFDAATPGLMDLLWSLAEARLAIDQPTYPGLALAHRLRTDTEEGSPDGLQS